ncbi:MAG TPA: SRPBCC domain-containing protein [Acidobacteriota bacterium]|nr:SRPBCC domain-containing protein [Acidobacteriota bacterium]
MRVPKIALSLLATLALAPALLLAPVSASAADGYERETIIAGPTDLVWRLLTTEDGIRSWLAPQADVDLRVGGLVRTHQDPKGRLGDAQTTVSRVLSLRPRRAFSVKVEQAPQGYPFAQAIEGTWYEVALEALPGGKTKVRCAGNGLASGWAGYAVRPAFNQGMDMVFTQLERAVARRMEKERTR